MFEEGQEVTYTGENGFEFQLEQANRYLQRGHTYTIDYIFRDEWGYYIYLLEVPNRSFNPNMFILGKKDLPKTPTPSVSKKTKGKDLPKEPKKK